MDVVHYLVWARYTCTSGSSKNCISGWEVLETLPANFPSEIQVSGHLLLGRFWRNYKEGFFKITFQELPRSKGSWDESFSREGLWEMSKIVEHYCLLGTDTLEHQTWLHCRTKIYSLCIESE